MWPSLGLAARVFLETDPSRAERLASELLSDWKEKGLRMGSDCDWLADIPPVLAVLGKGDELVGLIGESKVRTAWREAAAAYVTGNFREAADIYASIGALPNEAYARVRAAEALVSEARRAEANVQLEPALAFWRSVGATAYVREGEALLAEAG